MATVKKENDKEPPVAIRKLRLRKVRANGGYKVHLLPEGLYESLCGHTPQNNNSLMRRRGKWLHVQSGAEVTCKKCIQEGQKRDNENN